MAAQTLKVQPRKVLGRKVKQLRREGILPANIYGRKIKSKAVQLNLDEFENVFGKAGETGLVKLVITRGKGKVLTTKSQGSAQQVLIHNVQLDPVTDTPIHADFLQVDLKEKVTVQVPVELSGESSAEKEGKGTVVQYINEIEVEALPGDLPEKLEIDLGRLAEVNDTVKVSDLEVDKKKIEVKNPPEQMIVKVEPPREEEVTPVVEEEVVEGEEPTESPEDIQVGKEGEGEERKGEKEDEKPVSQKSQRGSQKTQKKSQ